MEHIRSCLIGFALAAAMKGEVGDFTRFATEARTAFGSATFGGVLKQFTTAAVRRARSKAQRKVLGVHDAS